MKNLLIYGVGGLGREIAELVKTVNRTNSQWDVLNFVDDNPNHIGKVFDGVKVIGGSELLSLKSQTDIVFGIASPSIKQNLYEKLKNNPFLSFPKIIHPCAVVAESADISEGCVIFNSCFVSVDTKIGKHALLSAGAQLAHDSQLGDFCSVMPSVNISGNVSIGERVYVGVQSAIRQGLTVGRDSVVGMGSVVVKNVPECQTVIGNPARRL